LNGQGRGQGVRVGVESRVRGQGLSHRGPVMGRRFAAFQAIVLTEAMTGPLWEETLPLTRILHPHEPLSADPAHSSRLRGLFS